VIRLVDRLAGVVCALAVLMLAVLLVAMAFGYRPLIDHSGSMSPAIRTGDLLITRAVPAVSVRPGAVVTFNDPALNGRLVTHRVIAVTPSARRLQFITRGDANGAPESWSVARGASVPKVVFRIAAIGYGLAWMGERWVRTVLLTLVALILSSALLRRIWRA
jgi:signal peptidase I